MAQAQVIYNRADSRVFVQVPEHGLSVSEAEDLIRDLANAVCQDLFLNLVGL